MHACRSHGYAGWAWSHEQNPTTGHFEACDKLVAGGSLAEQSLKARAIVM